MLKIYLAARYSRREELCGYRDLLDREGMFVTSRWLDGDHQISDTGAPIGDNGTALIEGDDGSTSARAVALRAKFAAEDLADVMGCDLLIAFTEPPRSNASRGGRHVELGLALGRKKVVFVVGPRENIFCWLPEVEQFADFASCLRALRYQVLAR